MAQHSDFLNTPIFVRPGMRAPYPTNLKTSKPEDFSPLQVMEHAALFDNEEEYIKGFKNWPSDKDIRHETWSYMFQYDSVKCATAVLDGETVAAVSDYGSSLLHEAAKFEAYNITAMLLDRGESADTEVNKLLPLELVMRTLMPYYIFTRESERTRGRDPEMSVFQTIVMLSAERRPNLETLRLLARRTQKIEGLFIKYLKEGKVVELVSLLMVGCRPSTTSISVDRLIAEIATLFEGGLPVKCEDTPSQELFRRHFFPDEEGEEYFSWRLRAF